MPTSRKSDNEQVIRLHLTTEPSGPSETRRLHALADEIRARLAPICVETPIATFNEMVLRIAHVQLTEERKELRTSPRVRRWRRVAPPAAPRGD